MNNSGAPAIEERLVRVTAGSVDSTAIYVCQRDPVGLCYLPTEAAVVGTVRAIVMWHACSTRRSWRPY
jgi:hypothetical protein